MTLIPYIVVGASDTNIVCNRTMDHLQPYNVLYTINSENQCTVMSVQGIGCLVEILQVWPASKIQHVRPGSLVVPPGLSGPTMRWYLDNYLYGHMNDLILDIASKYDFVPVLPKVTELPEWKDCRAYQSELRWFFPEDVFTERNPSYL